MSFWKTVGDLALKARKASVEMAKDAKDRNDNYNLNIQVIVMINYLMNMQNHSRVVALSKQPLSVIF